MNKAQIIEIKNSKQITEENKNYFLKTGEDALINFWLEEERVAHIKGWDFSHIHGRYDEENDLPWDYKKIIEGHLKPEFKVLDIDTGGGEFLLSLNHPHKNLSATEAYAPNVKLCEDTLLPLGIDFKEADGGDVLPFADGSFDMVINRHGDFNPEEIKRVLKTGGLFITEQVGAENDRDLAELIMSEVPPLLFPDQYLKIAVQKFETLNFEVVQADEVFRPIRFFDVGALVWFARIIEWEFPGFSVDSCLEELMEAQKIIEKDGVVEGTIHRFLLVARKK